MSGQQRREYLTPETSRVIFSRAHWFVLEGEDSQLIELPNKSGDLKLYCRPAGLVMMEWERELQRLDQPGQPVSDYVSLLTTGFLVLETWFPDGAVVHLDDLLRWNELARYYRCPWEGHEEIANNKALLSVLEVTKPEDYLKRWSALLDHPIKDESGRLLRIMPRAWLGRADALARGGRPKDEALPHWMVHADNRCHVWTCAVHTDNDVKEMCQKLGAAKDGGQALPDFHPWLWLLNADKPGSSGAVSAFKQQWLLDRTYTRWSNEGALYGFTAHSGAMLTIPCQDPDTWQHFRCLYFDQLLLMLYVRTSLFRFSERLSTLACEAGKILVLSEPLRTRKQEKLANDFDELRWEFAQLTNLYMFPQISHQQQALEMYELLRQQMVVEEFFRNVRTEIETTQTLLADRVSQRQGHATLQLTKLAFLGLLLSLTVSALSVSALQTEMKSLLWNSTASSMLAMLVLGVAVSLFLLWWLRWFFDRPWMKRFIRKCLKLDF